MNTWDIRWVSPYESPWSIVNKFMLANTIFGRNAALQVTTGKKKDIETYRNKNIHTGVVSNYEFDKDKATWIIGDRTISDYGEENIQYLLKPLFKYKNNFNDVARISNSVIRKTLYYCPDCMKSGNHYLYQQFSFMNECINHKKKLLNLCPVCNNEIPYLIEFHRKIISYQCKSCNSLLFKNDNFGIVIDEWKRAATENVSISPFRNSSIIPFIIANNQELCIQDKEINSTLYALFMNKKINVLPKHRVKKSSKWTDIDLGDTYTSVINKNRLITEYAYVYAFKKLYKHTKQDQKIKSRICKAEEYFGICKSYQLINQNTLEKAIMKYFDSSIITFYLWKRDLEFDIHNGNDYRYNTMYNKFNPDFYIMKYLKRAHEILPYIIDDDYRFSILVHIAIKLMKDKYLDWNRCINDLMLKHNKYELLNKLRNISLRNHNISKDILLLIDQEKKEFCLYYE